MTQPRSSKIPLTVSGEPQSWLFPETAHGRASLPKPFYWVGVAALFVATHCNSDLLRTVSGRVWPLVQVWAAPSIEGYTQIGAPGPELLTRFALVPLRCVVFTSGSVLLLWVLCRGVRRELSTLACSESQDAVRMGGLILLGLGLLQVPFRFPYGVGSMGVRYGVMAMSPFEEGTNLYYRRLLMPVLGHLLGFQGPHLYWLFSMLVVACLVLLTVCALSSALSRERYSFTERLVIYLSAVSTSFVVYQFQFPGYPDGLVFLIALAAACLPLTGCERGAAIALSMAAHEASAFIWLPAIVFFFPRKQRLIGISTLCMYGLLWVSIWGSSLRSTVAAHADIGGLTPLQYAAQRPVWTLLGIFLAHKLLWILPAVVAYWHVRRGNHREGLGILALCVVPLVQVALAVDISRLVGFGFLAILVSLREVAAGHVSWFGRRCLLGLALANLSLPSYYVGSNTGPQLFGGFYRWTLTIASRVLQAIM